MSAVNALVRLLTTRLGRQRLAMLLTENGRRDLVVQMRWEQAAWRLHVTAGGDGDHLLPEVARRYGEYEGDGDALLEALNSVTADIAAGRIR